MTVSASGAPTISVEWNANDGGGAGIAGTYDVQVREDDGPWTGWLTDTAQTQAEYVGQSGHQYTFRVTATDRVGNGGQGQASAIVTAVTKYYYFGSRRVAMRGPDETVVWLHGDHLGSTSLATDAAQGVVSRQLYYPFGETRWTSVASLPTDFQFTGQRIQSTIALYDYHARFYDPYVGRFVSADTVVPEPGDPQQLNRYSYTRNNPMKYVDPSGHKICIDEECSSQVNPITWETEADQLIRQLQYGYGREPNFVSPPINPTKISPNPTNGFGNTRFAYNQWSGQGNNSVYSGLGYLHSGIDIFAPQGTPLSAMDYGVVVCTGRGCFMGINERGVAIRSGDYIVVYGHVRNISVQAGDTVKPGTEVAAIDVDHLHLEVRKIGKGAADSVRHNQFCNPLPFFESSILRQMDLKWQPYVDSGGNVALEVDYNQWTMASYTRPGNWWDGTLTAVEWSSIRSNPRRAVETP